MVMRMVTKWRVSVVFQATTNTFWVHNDHLANVLRQVADMQFSENGLEQPTQIIIGRVPDPQQEGVLHK